MGEQPSTILIADDSQVHISILQSILGGDGYALLIAHTGQEVLELVTLGTLPDLILLDVNLPLLTGYEVCQRLKANPRTARIPVIFLTAQPEEGGEEKGLALGAVDFLVKPVSPPIVKARVRTHLALANQTYALEKLVRERTAELEATQEALRQSMGNLLTVKVTAGVFWVQVPEAGLNILCGCPGEVVKHLMHQGFIKTLHDGDIQYETGPNVILLSDLLVQNGGFANLAEFPVLQMLYRQGVLLPGHPNNTGQKPLIIGSAEQVKAQLEYIHRGNYGLLSKEEILATGIEEELAEQLMRIKLHFAFGAIHSPAEFVDTLVLADEPVEIRGGVKLERLSTNKFRFHYRNKTTDVDLNLAPAEFYKQPYTLGRHHFKRHYFAVLHCGEGDGWDVHRPSMGSVLMFQGRIFLIDAGPSIIHSLTALGIDISEVDGIFHTHCHDDHFAGLPGLIRSDHRLKYYATPLVRTSVMKKFAALMSLEEREFERFFEIHDLVFDIWNECEGLEVMPIYSPHPVESNLFMFRALDAHGYKTYAHWADLSAFEVLDRMLEPSILKVNPALIAKVKQDYLQAANLKKLDIGGGLIHGRAEDFRQDESDQLLLAHIARDLTLEEMEIGSESYFGALDVLIEGQQDYFRQRAFLYLRALFPDVDSRQFRILLDCPIIEYNAGTIICRGGDRHAFVDMVLSGTVAYIDSCNNIHNTLSFGSLIGEDLLFNHKPLITEGTFRAVSHCSALRLSISLVRTFLSKNQLFDHMCETIDKIWFLRTTVLFAEHTTFLSLQRVARHIQIKTIKAGEWIAVQPGETIWLVQAGTVDWIDPDGGAVRQTSRGDFFGECQYLLKKQHECRYQAQTDVTLLSILFADVLEVPVVYWKLLEIMNKRTEYLNG